MARADAWLIEFVEGGRAAIGERELFHILYQAAVHPVPRAPRHCAEVVEWEGQLLPLWDIDARLGGSGSGVVLVAVVGYQDAAGGTAFGALRLHSPPQRIQVDDEAACAMPEDQPVWRALSRSCFLRGDLPVPVLDLAGLFAAQVS
jgi:hypothetical protein